MGRRHKPNKNKNIRAITELYNFFDSSLKHLFSISDSKKTSKKKYYRVYKDIPKAL